MLKRDQVSFFGLSTCTSARSLTVNRRLPVGFIIRTDFFHQMTAEDQENDRK